jgi:hypothetical protein
MIKKRLWTGDCRNHDSEAQIGRVLALFTQEKSHDGKRLNPGTRPHSEVRSIRRPYH